MPAALRNSASKKQSHEPSWSEDIGSAGRARVRGRTGAGASYPAAHSLCLPRLAFPFRISPTCLPSPDKDLERRGGGLKQFGAPLPPPLHPPPHSTRRPAPASPAWAPGLRTAPAPAQGSRGGRGSGAGWGRADSGLLRQRPREGILDVAPPPHVCSAQRRVPPS